MCFIVLLLLTFLQSSFADPTTRDRTIDLLGSVLNGFSRLTEVLRFAEVVSWVEEVLVYLEAAFTWAPSFVLDAAINLLRVLFGTNLSSIWTTELSSKFHAVFDFDLSPTSETSSLDEQIKLICETHFENASQIRFSNAIGRSFLDWLHSARQSHQPAMLRPESLPTNIQQPNLAYYIRLFEPLVLQCIHQYHLHTDPAIQAKILQILTVLIELGVNYAQLDEESCFLKTLITQCESLQHSNATASYNHQTSSKNASELVSSLFKFFIVLTYERKNSGSSNLQSKTVLTLSEVVHLAEVLAAGGVDVDSFVIPALAPLIIDIYVHRGARYHPALRINALNSPQEKLSDLNAQVAKDLHDWTAHREAMLRFLLPKFIEYPKTFDFLCVVLEDASRTDTVLKVAFESGESSLAYRTATEIFGHFLTGLADCSLNLDSCGDVDACLRLVRRLASPHWPTATVHDVILHQIVVTLYKERSEAISSKQSPQQLQRSMACKFVCLRFLLLVAIKQPSNLFPALRDFGNCGQSDPRAVLLEHLLDYLATICESILDHLTCSLDDIFVSSTESQPGTFLGQLLLAFQLDILTLGRLHALTTTDILTEKIGHLDAIFSTYGRFKPLVAILWYQLRAEIFQTPIENHIQLTPYHRNSVCVRKVTFLLRSRIKKDGFTHLLSDIDLLDLMKSSELTSLILSIGDTKQRLELLKQIISTTVLRFETAVVPFHALPQLKNLRVLTLLISNLIGQGWEVNSLKSFLLDLTTSFKEWFDIRPKNPLFALPAIRRELEFALINCLMGVENLKLDELPEGLDTFLKSLDSSKAFKTFFTTELPKTIARMSNRLTKNLFKEEIKISSAKDMAAASLSNALNVYCKDGGRLAAKLIQSNPHFELPTDLPPRFLQHVIRIGFVTTMKRFSPDASGAFETDSLWREGKEILFQKLNSLYQVQDVKDSIKQRQLVGLAAATIDFLILSTRLPLPSAPTDEEIEVMTVLLQMLVQIFIRIITEESDDPLLINFDLPLLALRLAIVLIASTNVKIQGFGKLSLETFIQFAEALNIAASLSKPNTLVPFRTSHSTDQILYRLRGLLVPKQPGIFRDSTNAYTLTRFTEVLNSFAANAGSTGGACGVSGGGHERSRVALASVFGLCRLCPLGRLYSNAHGMGSTHLSTQFSAFLITLCRRRDILLALRQPNAFSESADIDQISDSVQNDNASNGILQWNPDRVAEMDKDVLAEVSTWLLSLGWLDKTMFESSWTALLTMCAPPQPLSQSLLSSLEDEDNPFLNSKEEQVEENHCRVICINALTRLLLNAAHRPKPGDPLNSSPIHQPRLSLPPQFMHTKIGCRISHVMGCLDQETRSWFCDISPTLGVIGYDAGNSEGSLSWLSANIDLEHPADLDSPANQVPIGCLVKWMLHSSESSFFEPDTIISCLQSLRLVHHAWLRPFEEHFLSRVIETLNTGTSNLSSTNQKSSSISSRLSAITSPQTLQRNKFMQLFKRGSKIITSGSQGDSENHLPLAFGDSILLTGVLSPVEKREASLSDISKAELESLDKLAEITSSESGSAFQSHGEYAVPSLAVLTAVVKSAVLCSDLFTTREQFLWLIGCLQAVYQSLPRVEEEGCDFSTAPIYTWLTAGLARCTAVLEATMLPVSIDIDTSSSTDDPTTLTDHSGLSTTQAPQQHHSAPILLANNLQAAVSIVAGAIGCSNSSSVALQDAGLHGAMDIFQAVLLLRATKHPALQQPALVNNPPTGSAILNMLLLQVCLYLENRLENLFESEVVLSKRWTDSKNAPANLLRIGSTNTGSGVSKITAGLVRNASTNTDRSNASSRSANSILNRAADVTFKTRPPSEWAAERISSHQCTVLATAFFIVEQFSPLAGSETTAIGRLVIRLTNQLIQLAGTMLHDVKRDFSPPARLSLVFKSRFSETQASLVCADCVVNSWVRGMQRLLLSGLIRRENCELLAKQATDRLISSNSNSLRLSSLNLLTTTLYTLNAADFQAHSSPDHRDGDSEHQIDPDTVLNSSTEFLTAMWQCLRGGRLQIVSSSPNSHYTTPHISPFEARCIFFSLASLLEDLGRCFGSVPTNPTALGGLVNKAVSEVARRSGEQDGYLLLTTSVLRKLVITLTKSSRKGGEVVREWVLLTLPSLLQQSVEEGLKGALLKCHGYWVAAVCILLANLNSLPTNSILNICMANLPPNSGCQQCEAKRFQDLLLAACSVIEPEDDFRGRLFEIIQKAGGLTALLKAFTES
nr:huntingtin [Hymenolepis microstoma]